MDKEQVVNIAKQYKTLLEEHLPVKAIYLYGSYSKGLQNATSDIDIAVVLEQVNEDFFTDTPLLWKLRRKISNLIEPVLITPDISNPLYRDIIKTGIKL